MSDLTLICGKCRKPILGSSGSISVSHAALARYRVLAREWEAKHGGHAVPASVLLQHPECVPWEAAHDACRDPGEADRYDLGANQVASWPDLARWTAHLLGKSWLGSTDWDDVLREAAGEIPAQRIRPAADQGAA